MKRILSLFLAVMMVACACTFVTFESAAASDDLVLQDIEYKEVVGRVNQNDCGFTQGSTAIYAHKLNDKSAPRNDSGWQFYYISLSMYSGAERFQQSGFSDRDIDEWFLEYMDGTLANLRKNGGNCLIRLTYGLDGQTQCEPTDFDQLLYHQTQMAEVFTKYKDVVALVECGMIGAFGEMWGGTWSDAKHKAQVLQGWLDKLPEEITVNVRTAEEYYYWATTTDLFKDEFRNKTVNGIKYPPSLTDKTYWQYPFYDTMFSRVGCYNDAMIQDGNDGGSFAGGRDNFMKWLSWKALRTNYGGEFSGEKSFRTNTGTTFWLPGRSFPEFYESHLSYYHGGNAAYSNSGYENSYANTSTFNTLEDAEAYMEKYFDLFGRFAYDMEYDCVLTEKDGKYVLNKSTQGWASGTMVEELMDAIVERADGTADLRDYQGQPMNLWFEDHIGYRYVLRESKMSGTVNPGGILNVVGTVDNVGFANVTREKAAEVIVTDGENEYVIPVDIDIRKWYSADRNSYDLELKLPSSIPAGEYQVFLRFAGKTPDGVTNPANGIRFCNPGEYTYTAQGSSFGVGTTSCKIIYNSKNGGNYIGTFTVDGDAVPGSSDSAKQVYTTFSDVADDYWGKDYIASICTMGYMGGIGGGKFNPEGVATRAQFVTVLYNLEGQPSVKSVAAPFTDIKGWYNAAIKWAYSEGIVNGVTKTTFDPNGQLTRETFATMLYRYAKYKGVDVGSSNKFVADYADAGKVSSWALEAMQWANANEYINGMTTTTLVPQGKATRAQMATIMVRYLSK
ncbi:MAG: DUF4832 domain-containing protein [Clostridia bacterium]|nr:DUF4832 domain-containing protein [Clostridia bacterium]